MEASRKGSSSRVAVVIILALLLLLTVYFVWRALQAGSAPAEASLVLPLFVAAGVTATLFAVIALVAWLSRGMARDEAELSRRSAAHPDEPWQWRPEWAEGRIEHLESRAGLAFIWAFALIWNLAVGGAAVLVVSQGILAEEPGAALALILFLLAGAFLVFLAASASLRRRRFGRSVFELTSLPGVLGGTITGRLYPPPNLPPGSEVTVALACHDIRQVGGDRSHFLTWRTEQHRIAGGGGSEIPIEIDVPYDCPATTPDATIPRSRIAWTLTASAELPGVDYFASFEVPIFETSSSDPTKVRGEAATRETPRVERPPTRIKVLPLPTGGTAFLYPRPGWLKWWLGLTALPVIVAVLVVRLYQQAGLEMLSTLAIGLGIGLGILAITVLGVIMEPRRLEVRSDRLEVRRGLGPLGFTRRLRRQEIDEIAIGSHPSGARMMYTVEAHLETGGKPVLSPNLRDEDLVKWLAAQIRSLVS